MVQDKFEKNLSPGHFWIFCTNLLEVLEEKLTTTHVLAKNQPVDIFYNLQ